MVAAALPSESRSMSGHARAVTVGLVAAILLLGPLAGAAVADPPDGTDPPTPSPTATVPQPIAPVVAPPAVTGIRFAPSAGTERLTVSWTGSAAARDYAVQARASGSGGTQTYRTTTPSLDLPQPPAGSSLKVRIIAHGPGGDSPAASGSWSRPAAVPPVTSAALTATPAGLRVTWRPAQGTPVGSRYLVHVRSGDGAVLARTVAGSSVGFAGVPRDTLYSASITTEAPDGRRSTAYDVSAVLVPREEARADPPLATSSGDRAGEPTRGATAPVVPAVEPRATVAPAAASAPLISSPAVALACALAAVLLGGSAIAVLLRRRPQR